MFTSWAVHAPILFHPKEDRQLKAITVRRPYCYAIIDGVKTVENRARTTTHRGRIAIHAGLGLDRAPDLERVGYKTDDTLAQAVIGTVEIVDSVPYPLAGEPDPHGLRKNPLAHGPYCWLLARPQYLPTPIPCRGQIAFFDVDL